MVHARGHDRGRYSHDVASRSCRAPARRRRPHARVVLRDASRHATSTRVDLLDRHSGTTGRAHLALTRRARCPGDGVREARAVRRRAARVRERQSAWAWPKPASTATSRPSSRCACRRSWTSPTPTGRPLRHGARRPRRVRAAGSRPEGRRHRVARRATSSSSSRALHAAVLGVAALRRRRRPRVARAARAPAAAAAASTFVQMAVDNLGDRLADGFHRARRALPRARARHRAAVERGRAHARARRPAPRQPVRRRPTATAPASSTGR